jgi:hypothetical protein
MSNEIMQSTVTEGYEVFKNEEGKFVRRATYNAWSSIIPVTKEQKIAMFNLMNSNDVGSPLKDYIGAEIEVADVVFNPYTSIDEKTGEELPGVLSYIFTPDGIPYVTSSKSVYFSLKRMFQWFGEPHYSEGETVRIQVVEKKGREHKYVDINIIG